MSHVGRLTLLGLLVAFLCRSLIAEAPKACREARKYEEIHTLIDTQPLVLSRLRGRVVVQGLRGEIRKGESPVAVCLSIFTSDSHRYLSSTTVDKEGRFGFAGLLGAFLRFL